MEPLLPLHVLVIEDDPDTRANLRDILELDDYQVETAGTVAQALHCGNWPRFAAIILDRRLPDGNAEELLPRLKELAPRAAVMIVTGYADVQGAIAALRSGAIDYVLKPINAEELRARLRHVAELIQAQDQVRTLSTIPAESPNPILRVSLEGNLLFANSSSAPLLKLWGCQEGQPMPDAWQQVIREVLASGTNREVEVECESRTFSLLFAPLAGADHLNVYGHDITALKEAQQRSLQAERLAAIGQMMTVLSHESGNALARSRSCLEMLGWELEDRPDALELIAKIRQAQDQLQQLYSEVRDYASPLKLDRETWDLSGIWRQAWQNLALQRQGKEAFLTEEIAGVDLECAVDNFRLEQVFRNLLENSLAACSSPVRIAMTCSTDQIGGQPALRVVVRDNGPGLNPQQKQRVFEPFYTTKSKGTGLGMAIAKQIVEAHGGRIAVGENSGPGAEFILVLPREEP
jgi:signal transduction histidine kinase